MFSHHFNTTICADLNKCELLCEADGYAFFDRLAAQVVDGTSCDDESNDVCIAGQCVVSNLSYLFLLRHIHPP